MVFLIPKQRGHLAQRLAHQFVTLESLEFRSAGGNPGSAPKVLQSVPVRILG
jgi:hypothetical protein